MNGESFSVVYFYFTLYDKFVYDGKFSFSSPFAVLCCVCEFLVPVVIRKRKMFSCLPYYRDDCGSGL